VRQLDDLRHRIDRAERVRDVRRPRPSGARREQLLELVQPDLAASSIGATLQPAPLSSQSICHGTMFEWCSRPLIRISSPGRCPCRPKLYATRLIASVVPRDEHDLAALLARYEACSLRARRRTPRRLGRDLVHAAVDVGVARLVDRALRVDHRRGFCAWRRCPGTRAGLPWDFCFKSGKSRAAFASSAASVVG
jgi:hypothetical protein